MKKKRTYKIVLSFLVTGLLFSGMMLFEKSKQPKLIMQTVIAAKEDIEEDICLTEENLASYVTEMRLEKTFCHGDNPVKSEELLGKKLKIPVKKGTVLQKSWFLDVDSISEQMKQPVRVSVKTEDLSDVLGGSLRSGDFINLYFYNEDASKASLIFRGVLVEESYDNAGKAVEKEDRERAAAMLTLLLEEEDVERLCELIAERNFRMAKTGNREVPYERLEEDIYVQDTKEESAS